ncbi:MAG: GNAT family N-acetyltransferase [Arthrobacter sp.]
MQEQGVDRHRRNVRPSTSGGPRGRGAGGCPVSGSPRPGSRDHASLGDHRRIRRPGGQDQYQWHHPRHAGIGKPGVLGRTGTPGAGLATRAVAEARAHSFDGLGLHRLQAETLVHNHAYQRVLTRNGFTRHGRASGYLKIAGRWQDHLMYQVLCTV